MFITLEEFLTELGWSEEKQTLFVNWQNVPKSYLSSSVLKRWKSILFWLQHFTKDHCSDASEVAENLDEKLEKNLIIVDKLLDKILLDSSTAGRVRPSPPTVDDSPMDRVRPLKPMDHSSSGRVRPSKLSAESVREIYQLAHSGQTAISSIAAQFGISRKTVDLIRTQQIHRHLLP